MFITSYLCNNIIFPFFFYLAFFSDKSKLFFLHWLIKLFNLAGPKLVHISFRPTASNKTVPNVVTITPEL